MRLEKEPYPKGVVKVIAPIIVKEKLQRQQRKMRVAAYCRVSTEQEEQLGSFENQSSYYMKKIEDNPEWENAGIFSDEGISGTGTKRRTGFQQMIQACQSGKVDMILTKSISRFARNTADCLQYTRLLKKLGVAVVFEREGINTMEASGELLFTILSSLAQEESRNISENIRWGIRSRFRQGIPQINTVRFMGYDKGEDGRLQINREQAKVVRRIYDEFLSGWSEAEIASRLKKEGIPGVSGASKWTARTIRMMLENEKYKGDLRMQKYFTVSYIGKQQKKNEGELEQFYIEGNHPAIIDPVRWELTQRELRERLHFRRLHGLRDRGDAGCRSVYYHRLFCGACGKSLVRVGWKGIGKPYWQCTNCHPAEWRLPETILEKLLREYEKEVKNVNPSMVKAEEKYTLMLQNFVEKSCDAYDSYDSTEKECCKMEKTRAEDFFRKSVKAVTVKHPNESIWEFRFSFRTSWIASLKIQK